MSDVFLGIGSNLGDRLENCKRAVTVLRENSHITVTARSPWYRSRAITLDDKPQSDYCNGVVRATIDLKPFELLSLLKKIEKQLGRMPSLHRWEPRIIDLDLLLYDDLEVGEKELTIPHPEMQKRCFVLQPLCDIAPRVVIPGLNEIASALLKKSLKLLPEGDLALWKE